jgi:hypothetical protein
LYQPEWAGDPYPFYRRLRDFYPVYRDDILGSWVVSRYDDIARLARDERLSEDRVAPFQARLSPGKQAAIRPLANALQNMMLFAGPPRHAQLRNLVKPGFSRSAVVALRDSIRRHVAAICDQSLTTGHLDVVGDFAVPLTKTVIAELIGLPAEQRHLLDGWQSLLHEYFTQSEGEMPRLARLRAVFDDLAGHDGAPVPGLLGHMMTECPAPSARDADVMFANFLLIIDAGQVTTTYLIPNAVRALARHRDQLDLLTARPDLIGSAAAEFLRFDSSVQFTTRTATADISFGGHTFGAGEAVTLLLGSGNRDERRFPDPDRLDVTRDARGHLSFGHDRHYCLGAALALAETEEAIAALLARTSDLRISAAELRWHPSINFRLLRELPVCFRPLRREMREVF